MAHDKGRAVFIYSPEIYKHEYPRYIPFVAKRTVKTFTLISELGLLDPDHVRTITPKMASRTDLEKFHTREYLDILQLAEEEKICLLDFPMGIGTLDCPVFKGMFTSSALACGATLTGADLLLAGEAAVVFTPSGGFHHAKAARASGFCYLNDVVLGCLKLMENGLRVVFLDLDAHHGDGVQEAFYERREVLTISLHESGRTLFPWTGSIEETGAGDGIGFNVNIPLPLGCDDKAYLAVFDQLVLPLIRTYGPDVIVVELGMDALSGDPLAHMNLTNNASAEILSKLKRLGGMILATGGGGYDVEKTVRGWALAWETLCCEEREEADFSLAMGGVMLQSRDWSGGLRDRTLPMAARQRYSLDSAVKRTITRVRRLVFGYHGLDTKAM